MRASELTKDELREGRARLVKRLAILRPRVVAIAGITAFRTAFSRPRAAMGRQSSSGITGWPEGVGLWVVPQPSGLNAHENIDSLAAHWRGVWREAAGDAAEL